MNRSAGARALLAAALTLAWGRGALAATWYVSTAGSDSNPGTSASPFLTIQKGVGAVSAGDTVVVENGTYLYTGGAGGNFVTLTRSGTAASPIMLRAQNPGQVFLKGNNNLGNDGVNVSGSYWIIGGFDVSGFAGFCVNHGNSGAGGIGIQLVGNNLHNCGNIGTSSSSYGVGGIFIGTTANTWTVNGNVIHDNGRARGLSTPNHDHGIYLDGASNILISNNIFYHALYGWHIKIGVGSGTIYVYNNTFDGPAGLVAPTTEPGSVVLTDSLSNIFLRNNIFYNPNADGVFNLSTMSGSCAVDHNLVYNSAAGGLGVFSNGTPAGCVVASNLLNVNPLLAAPASFNFALSAGSPAIGAGVALSNVTLDFNGVSRATRNDLGALAYSGSAASPPPASGPLISAVTASGVTVSAATIDWSTDKSADSQVVYGPTSAYGSSSALNSTLTTSHSVALSGLTAGTGYHYAVKSRDSSGNLATSPDATFTTLAPVAAGVPAGCVSSAGAWRNLPLAAHNGSFTAQFDVTAGAAAIDGVSGLSNGAATAWSSLAAAVRFNNTGMIDARNGAAYAASAAVPYVTGMTYHVRLVVNVPAHSYSAYVKQGSNAEQLIGSNYAFRSEQASVTSLSNAGVFSDEGSITTCNASAASVAATGISAIAVSAIAQTVATIGWTTNVSADGQVVYGPTTAYGSATAVNSTLSISHSFTLSGLTGGTLYHYAVKSHDSSGNLATSPDATFTTLAPVAAGVPSGCVSSAGAWQNLPLAAQNGFFTAEFNATPGTAITDGVAGLSNGAASGYASLAAAVRFNNTGKIDARNDGSYAAAASIPYVAGMAYHFRLVVNLPTRTYSAYVKQGSNSELLIGSGYAFRTEQSSVAQLNGLGTYAGTGSALVCNAAVTASAPPTIFSGITASAIGPTTATIAWTTNNPADTQMQYGLAASYGVTTTLNSTPVTSHGVSLGGLTAATLYHYRVMSRDAAGNLVTSPDATFTTTANTTPPVIGGVSATAVGPASAAIVWTTDKPADSQVAYGPGSTTVTVIAAGSIYTSATTIDPALTTSHSVPLSGLTASTLYHYAVKSRDSSGNLATSPDATFTTAAAATAPAPAPAPAPVPVAPACATTSGGAWKNAALTSETGSFTAEFDATPSAAKVDAVAGVSDGPAYAWSSVAAAVRFNNTGRIDARNGGTYAAAASIPYVAGLSYHFRLVVNIPAHSYSAYVKQGANSELLIGSGYAFRTEQKSVRLLNNIAAMADSGSLTVCNGTAHQ